MESIDVSVLQPVYRELYGLLGEDGLVKVFEYYRGDQMTFPSHLYRGELVSKKLGQSEVNSSDYRALARYYGYSERTGTEILEKSLLSGYGCFRRLFQ